MRSRRFLNIIYLLGLYVAIQLFWWGYRITQLTGELHPEGEAHSRSVWMIIGEGSVFLLILILGFWQLRRSIRQHDALNEKEKNFVLSVSHELKTPIAANKLCLETLEKRELTPEQRAEVLTTAQKANDRLEAMVDKILLTATLEEPAHVSTPESIEVEQCLQKIVDQQTCHQKVVLKCQTGIRMNMVKADLETIADNLIQNAIKYSPSSSILTIEAVQSEAELAILFKDEGPGIPEHEKKKIFDKFYRIGDELTRNSKGTGLGLFITKKLVEMNNGKIEVLDNQPQGTIFKISFKK